MPLFKSGAAISFTAGKECIGMGSLIFVHNGSGQSSVPDKC